MIQRGTVTAWNDVVGTISATLDNGAVVSGVTPVGYWPAPGSRGWFEDAGLGVWVCLGPDAGAGVWNTWVPGWTSAISPPTLGNGTIVARYCRVGKLVTIALIVQAGSGSSGGLGGWAFTLPVISGPMFGGYGGLVANLYQPAAGVNWQGFGFIPATSNQLVPLFTISQTDARTQQGQNADASAAVGTGRPAAAGAYPLAVGGSIAIAGSYECA